MKRADDVAQQYFISSLVASPLPMSPTVANTKRLPSSWNVPMIVSGLPRGPCIVPENELPSCLSIFIVRSVAAPLLNLGLGAGG
jgi:hypothetical protein